MIKSSDDETKKYACRPGMTSRRFWVSNNGGPDYVASTSDHSYEACAAACNTHEACIAFDWTDYFAGTDSNQCRLVRSVTGEFTPRNDPATHEREFCQLQYTCEQFSGSCDENQFKKNDEFVCGTSACTKEQCCVDKTDVEVCDFNVNMCSANEGICKWTETHRRKVSFDEVKCDGPCTVEQCCDHYGA